MSPLGFGPEFALWQHGREDSRCPTAQGGGTSRDPNRSCRPCCRGAATRAESFQAWCRGEGSFSNAKVQGGEAVDPASISVVFIEN